MTLVDTNIFFDLITKDRAWMGWSMAQLDNAAAIGSIVINDLIYAELSARFQSLESFETYLKKYRINHIQMPRPALFLAAKIFQKYRAAGGKRPKILPDFFIGAHAAVANVPLLTRDPTRYKTYFPNLTLIAPPPAH